MKILVSPGLICEPFVRVLTQVNCCIESVETSPTHNHLTGKTNNNIPTKMCQPFPLQRRLSRTYSPLLWCVVMRYTCTSKLGGGMGKTFLPLGLFCSLPSPQLKVNSNLCCLPPFTGTDNVNHDIWVTKVCQCEHLTNIYKTLMS